MVILERSDIRISDKEVILVANSEKLIFCDWKSKGAEERLIKYLNRYFKAASCKMISLNCLDPDNVISEAYLQLEDYFNGRKLRFELPIEAHGTEFQKKVWERLQEIPYGETLTYSMLAEMIGNSEARRAVAQACGANPLSIIVPCHRVVAAGGLGGYAGGRDKKMFLIELEQNFKK